MNNHETNHVNKQDKSVLRSNSKQLSNDQRHAIVQQLLSSSENGVLKHGAITKLASEFDVNRKTVQNIWKRGLESIQTGSAYMDVSSRKSKCGRKKKDYSAQMEALSSVPLNQRSSERATAAALNIPKSTFHDLVSNGAVRVHSSATKPYLTPENMKNRLEFCLKHIDMNRGLFKNMEDIVHIDEKCFYMTKNPRRYYLAPDEHEPQRTTKSKRFTTKVMFLCAVARPRWDRSRNRLFDGKIGIWPFSKEVIAQRRSRNRPAGTPETKPIDSVTKIEYREFLINKEIPAIQYKWPVCQKGMTIIIQQDNAKPHINPLDPSFQLAALNSGMDIKLEYQPANSPDLNVLDLGYFNAIQSIQHQSAATTVDEMILAVMASFDCLDSQKLNNVFLTLQKVMELCIIHGGNNNYKLPHMSKQKLERLGELPRSILVSDELRNAITDL